MMADEPDTSPVSKQPIADQDRDEDSGLHDIRNLAQSTKQRLSSRRITSPPISDDDVLASSSGAFKNIALPQPAKMVSLPEVADLPPVSKAEEKAAKKAAKEAARESKKDIAAVSAAASIEAPAAAPAASVAPARSAFTLPSQQRKSSKGPILTLLGLGMAAAAGGVIYMQMNKTQDASAVSSAQAPAEAPALAATGAAENAGSAAAVVEAAPAPEPVPAAAPPVEEPKEQAAAQIATDDVKAEPPAKKGDRKKTKSTKKVEDDDPKFEEKVETKKPEKPAPAASKGGEAEGEPSFDALLKEAGVTDQKKEAKPKLDKKSLTGDDFKKGMSGPAAKAKGCYKGTQGTAMIKLTVAPSGQISKVTVSGEFAGKPEGSCVESAIKAATFPPWDGGPQSFTYSVLLSD